MLADTAPTQPAIVQGCEPAWRSTLPSTSTLVVVKVANVSSVDLADREMSIKTDDHIEDRTPHQ